MCRPMLVTPPPGKPVGTVFISVTCGRSHVCGLISDGTHHCQDIGYETFPLPLERERERERKRKRELDT
jgi:hypothetical protein